MRALIVRRGCMMHRAALHLSPNAVLTTEGMQEEERLARVCEQAAVRARTVSYNSTAPTPAIAAIEAAAALLEAFFLRTSARDRYASLTSAASHLALSPITLAPRFVLVLPRAPSHITCKEIKASLDQTLSTGVLPCQ